MKHVLVTGGAGFVGSSIAFALRRHYSDVRITTLDNLTRAGSHLNVDRLRAANIAFQHGDIRNPEDLAAVDAFDLLVECSAEPSALAGYDGSPSYVINTNLVGTANCLEAARIHGADVLFFSTSRVYPIATLKELRYHATDSRFVLDEAQTIQGASGDGVAEDFPLAGSRTMYGATKLCSEYLIEEFRAMYGMRAVINRCGLLTGPWQMGKVDQGVVALWVARHVFERPLRYIGYGGTGKQVRDMLHIDDLVELVLHQITHLDQHDGAIYNVGGGNTVSASLAELTTLCQEATGNRVEIAADPEDRPGDIPIFVADCRRVQEACDWQPSRSTGDIVEDITRWVTDNRDTLESIL
jgi:CDP-paratose 2-epimerase